MSVWGIKLAFLVVIGMGLPYLKAQTPSFQTQPEAAQAVPLRKKPWLQRVRTFSSHVIKKGTWQEKLVWGLWIATGLSALLSLIVFLAGLMTQRENWLDHFFVTAFSAGGAGLLWFLYACLSGSSGGSIGGGGGGGCGSGGGGSLGSPTCGGGGSSSSVAIGGVVLVGLLLFVIVGGLLFSIGYAIWYLAKGRRRRS